VAVTEPNLPVEQNETPDDVATLYSWANLHGAKYRDFSATRALAREEARRRVEEAQEAEARRKQEEEDRRAQEEAQLAARKAAEAAEAARQAEAERLAEIARQAEAERQAVLAAQQAQRLAAQQRAWQPQAVPSPQPFQSASMENSEIRPAEFPVAPAVSIPSAITQPTQSFYQPQRLVPPVHSDQSQEASYAPQNPSYERRAFQEHAAHSYAPQSSTPAPSQRSSDTYRDQRSGNSWQAQDPNDGAVRPAWLAGGSVAPPRELQRPIELEPAFAQPSTAYQPQPLNQRPSQAQSWMGASIPGPGSSPMSGQRSAPMPVPAPAYAPGPITGASGPMVGASGAAPLYSNSGQIPNANPGQPPLQITGQMGGQMGVPAFTQMSGQNPGQLPNPQPGQFSTASEDILASSRDRMVNGWFALKSIFDPKAAPAELAPVQPPAKVPVLAVFSLAGGVGKTSIVASLGRALSSRGERILLVDTAAFGLLPFFFGARDQRPGVLRTFSPPGASSDAPVQLVALDPESQAAEVGGQDWIVQEVGRYSRGVSRILVDLPTASGATTRRVLRLNPTVLVPVIPDMNSVVSVGAIESFFRNHSNMTGVQTMPYYLLNQFDYSQPLHLDVREILREQIGDRLLPFPLRRSPAISEALAEGMTVMEYAPNTTATEDYASLAGWVRSLAAPANVAQRGVRWSER